MEIMHNLIMDCPRSANISSMMICKTWCVQQNRRHHDGLWPTGLHLLYRVAASGMLYFACVRTGLCFYGLLRV